MVEGLRKLRAAPTMRAGLIAALISGVPSTAHAIVTGNDPLEATTAAGSLIVDASRPRVQLALAAVPVHLAISLFWAFVLAAVLPQRGRRLAGAVSGLGIAYLDLILIGRRFPRLRALSVAPQVADHVLFGALVGHLTRVQDSDG